LLCVILNQFFSFLASFYIIVTYAYCYFMHYPASFYRIFRPSISNKYVILLAVCIFCMFFVIFCIVFTVFSYISGICSLLIYKVPTPSFRKSLKNSFLSGFLLHCHI